MEWKEEHGWKIHSNNANTNAIWKQMREPILKKDDTRVDDDLVEWPVITPDRTPLFIMIFQPKDEPESLSPRRCSDEWTIFRRSIEFESWPSSAEEIVRDSESKRREIRAIGRKQRWIAAICLGQIQLEDQRIEVN